MNREQIIQMAREAGGADISMNGWTSWVGTQSTDFLERFAKLVAEHEREAGAKVCEKYGFDNHCGTTTDAIATAIRARGQA